jgi:hypothetical protein
MAGEQTPERGRRGWADRCRHITPVRLLEGQAIRLRALAEERDQSQAFTSPVGPLTGRPLPLGDFFMDFVQPPAYPDPKAS